jgi:hypothetical protein
MNCKQGDIAIVVRIKPIDPPSILGRIVHCVKAARHPLTGEHGWEIEPELMDHHHILDSALRPIRNEPGEDESLTWAGRPQEVTA